MTDRRQFLQQSLQLSLYSVVASASTLALVGRRAQAEMLAGIPAELPPGQSIFTLSGQVWVDGHRATQQSQVTADSLVRTGSNSTITFVVGQDAYLLRENSELQLSSEGALITGLRLLTGRVLSVFGERTEGNGRGRVGCWLT